MSSSSPATADLCDAHVASPDRLAVVEPGYLNDYGGKISFHGKIETIRCLESNPLVRQVLSEPGSQRVLVVDGGASHRCALLGDELALLALKNQWAGVIINGCIRDSAEIAEMPIGVKARNTHPLKSIKTFPGERGCTVAFAGVEFITGYWIYADAVSHVWRAISRLFQFLLNPTHVRRTTFRMASLSVKPSSMKVVMINLLVPHTLLS
jgi:regulator of ribonuclease activity A